MTTHPWRAALTRWGDTLFRLALLLTNDRAAAERATIQAFTQSFATQSDNTEAALYTALLRTRPGRRHPFRRRALPRPLDRIAPLDRALLGLWLLRDIDGPHLQAITGLTTDVLLARMSAALMPFINPQDPAHTDRDAQAAFTGWLKRRLGLAATTPGAAYDSVTTEDWQAAIDQVRHTLREAVGRQHLPQTCLETIEADMLEPPDESAGRWWRQRAAWIGALVIILSMLWMIKPWQAGGGTSTAAALTTKELIQETLDGWTTLPISGTLHRQVVAVDPRFGQTPLTTDVWLAAESAQHRIEVRNKTTLVEWQIGNGTNKFDYAAETNFSACDWAVETTVLDRMARTFTIPAEEQAAARDARLIRGAYGQGYRALEAALAAPDLRSFGTRVEGKTPLLVLGYTDRRSPSERKLLLWIDPAAKALHAVREVAATGAQADARDLWRLQLSEEVITGMSRVLPSWPRSPTARDTLFDPACPGLDRQHVISLREFVGSGWWSWQQWYLPATVPTGITRAALLSPAAAAQDSAMYQYTMAVFVGPNRWLTLRTVPRETSNTSAIARGPWRVTLEEEAGVWRSSVCRHFDDARNGFCVPSVSLVGSGWTRDELLAVIDSLKPVSGQTWNEMNDLFLDPQPLSAEAQTTIKQSLAAIQQLKRQALHSVVERTARVNPQWPQWQDPYHVPLDRLIPDYSLQEQWLVYSDTEVAQFRDVISDRQGNLLNAQASNGRQYAAYNISSGTAWSNRSSPMPEWYPTVNWTGENLLLALLTNRAQPTITHQEDTWLLEQPVEQTASSSAPYEQGFLGISGLSAWIADLAPPRFVQRIWLDRATYLPTRATVVHIGEQGRETEVLKLTISAREPLATPPDDFELPPLPAGTIEFEVEPYRSATLVEESLRITLPARILAWSTASGARIERDVPLNPDSFTTTNRTTRVQEALFTDIDRVDTTGLIQKTTYQWPPDNQSIVVRQGPSSLLQHTLRYRLENSGGQMPTWTSSEPLSASIAGAPRAVWLLEAKSIAALVFEIDDLLVHVSGPDAATLKSTVLPQLARLEWTPVKG